MKENLVYGLDHLMDITITSTMMVSLSLELSDIDITRLVYLREKGMMILSKTNLFDGTKIKNLDVCEQYASIKQCKVKFNTSIYIIIGTSDYINSNL